jgi:transcriptional regulator with XRE-family HTH domain
MWREMSTPGAILTIGDRIKENRLRRNITREDLAERAGISKLTVANAEAGKNISLSVLINILRQLDMMENLELLVPKPPISPILMRKLQGKSRKRARKDNNIKNRKI